MKVSAAMTGEGAAAQPVEATLDLQPGLNRGTLPLPTGDLPSGNYTLRVSFQDPNGNAVSAYEDSVFVMNQREVEEAKNAVSGFKGQEALQPSLSNLEIRYDWLDEFYQRTQYEDISALQGWWDDIRALTSRLERESRPSSVRTRSRGTPTARRSTTPCSRTRSSCRRTSMPASSIRSSSPCTAAASTNRPRCRGSPRPPACWAIR